MANNEKTDAIKLLRRTLAESKEPVSIVTTGDLTNIYGLMISQGDEYSPLMCGGNLQNMSETDYLAWEIHGITTEKCNMAIDSEGVNIIEDCPDGKFIRIIKSRDNEYYVFNTEMTKCKNPTARGIWFTYGEKDVYVPSGVTVTF